MASSTPPPSATPNASESWMPTWLMTLACPASLSSTSAKTKALVAVQKIDWKKPVTTRIAMISQIGVPGV